MYQVNYEDAKGAFKAVLEKIINSHFNMAIDWEKEFKNELISRDNDRALEG